MDLCLQRKLINSRPMVVVSVRLWITRRETLV